jgi:hypothetical protein
MTPSAVGFSAMDIELDAIEQRVIGCLLEKERTVPDSYPMTLNGLRTACNQSSGRDPIMTLTDREVSTALDRVRAAGLTRVLHASHGARVPKYRQVLDEVLGLDGGERAALTLLLLRGPQTPGEIRSRSERLHAFAELGEVDAALTSLAGREPSLVVELDRQPGQKEQRWRHLLGPAAASTYTSRAAGTGADVFGSDERDAEIERLRLELAGANEEITNLRRLLDELTAPD